MRNISIFRSWGFSALLFLCQELSAFPEPSTAPQASASPEQLVLNVSTDLSQLPGKYQMPNMVPNNAAQDSAPLLNDAIQFVSYYNGGKPPAPYTRIVADPGHYYFYTAASVGGPNSPQAYVLVDQLQNVTIDLADSSLSFGNALNQGFNVSNSQNLVVGNFSIDYLTLPFTELRVQQVFPGANQILTVPLRTFPSEPKYVGVYELQQSQPGATLYGFDFYSDGRMKPSMARWGISQLSGPNNLLTLQGDFNFAFIKPFDIFEVEARGGGPAIWVESSSSIQLKQLSIYSGGGVGIITNCCPFTSIENVKVIPRPHTNRLVSTNAGGIAVNSTAQDNVIRNCTISGTQDDCISGNAPAIGYLQSIEMPSTCVLLDPNIQLFTQGLVQDGSSQIYFVDPVTGAPLTDGSGHTIILTIQSHQYSVINGVKQLTVTMTSPLPELPVQAMMFAVDPATRGDGLIIDSNDISYNRLARGIALSGQTGVTITNNTLSEIQEAGILFGTNYSGNPNQPGNFSTFGPVSNIFIQQNHLHRTNIGTGPLGITMLAAIQILTINLDGMPATAEANQSIYILDNEIDETPRTGIWVMNTGSGEISKNKIHRWGYDTTIPPNSHINSGFSVTSSDFQQPLVIQSSSVNIGANQQLGD
jgi:hypothetical protein